MRESGDREDMATAILTAASTSAKLLVDTSLSVAVYWRKNVLSDTGIPRLERKSRR